METRSLGEIRTEIDTAFESKPWQNLRRTYGEQIRAALDRNFPAGSGEVPMNRNELMVRAILAGNETGTATTDVYLGAWVSHEIARVLGLQELVSGLPGIGAM